MTRRGRAIPESRRFLQPRSGQGGFRLLKLVAYFGGEAAAQRFPAGQTRSDDLGALAGAYPWLRSLQNAVGHVLQHYHHFALVAAGIGEGSAKGVLGQESG